ncbi:hypothetical protein ACJMK2_027849 [Sinanodonta woodiana]|uniref:Uncharacterized protein n=1 Tax=Sinanodonta woodiana TaxID=1069815 RepID=A0ABD3X568_SINWO
MLWIFALIMFLPAPISAAEAHSCLNSTKSKFYLSCSDDGRIVDIDIAVALGDCKNSMCSGNTPQLIMQTFSCYWKNNCTIDLPLDIIIQSTDDSEKCIGTKPDILLLYSWKCTKKNVQIYDFQERTDFNMSGGILRSHSRFPWNYLFSDFCTDRTSSMCSRNVTFWLNPKQTFVITVQKVNISESDNLTLHTKQDIIRRPVSVGTMTFDDSAEAIYLQLSLTEDTKEDSGFFFCYKSLSSGKAPTDACSDLTTLNKRPQILTSAVEKDTPKRKGGKKKGKNKTENNDKQKGGNKPKGKKRQM